MLKTLKNLKPSWFKSLKSDDVSTFAQRHYQVSDERNENEYKCKIIPKRQTKAKICDRNEVFARSRSHVKSLARIESF